MKNLILVLAAISLLTVSSNCQYKWDVGIKLGGSNYLGDIGGQELTRRDFVFDMHLDYSRANYAIFARRKMNKRWALAFNGDYVSTWGFDANSTNPARRARNLNFRNRIFELGGRGELTIFYDNDVGGKGYYDPDFRLFVFAGLAGFYHNPQGQIFGAVNDDGSLQAVDYKNPWINLRELRTENQDEEYSTLGLAIPAGVGMYFTFNKKWRFGWELNWRTTFTDYLDDISTTYGDIDQISANNGGNEFAVALAQQSNQNVINLINSDPSTAGEGGELSTHRWNGYRIDENGNEVAIPVKRGDPTHNDSYITMAFTGSYVIRGASSFYKAKYSWLKQRRGSRRSRAKF